jgi:hypothetical protein
MFLNKVSPPPSESKINRARNQRTVCGWHPEDGGNKFPLNVGLHTFYTALYPKKMTTFITTAVRTSDPIMI